MAKKQQKKDGVSWKAFAGIVVFVIAAGRSAHAPGHAAPAHTTAAAAVPAPVVAAGSYTPGSWARAFLAGIPEPLTPCNLAAVVAWEGAEGGEWNNGAHYNPLNTTLREPGSYSINSVGVQSFTSWQEGLDANIHVIRLGYYTGIRAAMDAGNDAQAIANAVASSPWGTESFGANC